MSKFDRTFWLTLEREMDGIPHPCCCFPITEQEMEKIEEFRFMSEAGRSRRVNKLWRTKPIVRTGRFRKADPKPMPECVVCFNPMPIMYCHGSNCFRQDGVICKTCNNGMCDNCCEAYMNSNDFDSDYKRDNTGEYADGYDMDVFIPCPMCRDINTYCI